MSNVHLVEVWVAIARDLACYDDSYYEHTMTIHFSYMPIASLPFDLYQLTAQICIHFI